MLIGGISPFDLRDLQKCRKAGFTVTCLVAVLDGHNVLLVIFGHQSSSGRHVKYMIITYFNMDCLFLRFDASSLLHPPTPLPTHHP